MQTPGAPRDRTSPPPPPHEQSPHDDADPFEPSVPRRGEVVLYVVVIVLLGGLLIVDVWQRTCGLGVRC